MLKVERRTERDQISMRHLDDAVEKDMVVILDEFSPDPRWYNTLVRVQVFWKFALQDIIEWTDDGISLRRRVVNSSNSSKGITYESIFNPCVVGWDSIEETAVTGKDIERGKVKISAAEAKKLLKLKGTNYRLAENRDELSERLEVISQSIRERFQQ